METARTKDDCIFCKIANHVIESNYVYENDLVAAFRDMNPQAPTHVLVVPKQHYDNIVDGVPGETLAAMAQAVDEVAKAEGVRESGFRVIANTGDDAGQTVHHLHWHVLGGVNMGERLA
jgi:histidine triad (HIT) family protein